MGGLEWERAEGLETEGSWGGEGLGIRNLVGNCIVGRRLETDVSREAKKGMGEEGRRRGAKRGRQRQTG